MDLLGRRWTIPVKWVTVGFILLFFIKAEQRWYFPNMYLDTLAQAATYTNWEAGKGWVAYDSDLAEKASMHRFPPVYPVLIGALNKFFGRWTLSIRLLDLLSLFVLFLAIDKVFRQHLSQKWEVDMLLFMAFGLAPFQYATGSGLLALAFFWWGIWNLLRYNNGLAKNLLGSVLLFGLAIWVRPAYLPFAAVIPLYLLWKGWDTREQIQWKALWLSSICLALICFFMLYWQQLGPNLMPKQMGFFPQHLLELSPFFLKSLFFWSWPQEFAVKEWMGGGFGMVKALIGVINLIVLVYGFRSVLTTHTRTFKPYMRISLLVLVLNVSFLCFLSLTKPAERWNAGNLWTYVAEDRYLLPLMSVLLLWVFIQMGTQKWLRLLIRVLVGMYLTFFVFVHGQIHFTTQTEFGFSRSYTHAMESSLLFLKKEGYEQVEFLNDPHHYLVEAYQMDAIESGHQFILEKDEWLNDTSRIIHRSGNWVLIELE